MFQLIDIFHNICQAFDNSIFSCIVFCDVSKAFDRVWHKGLLFKLRQNGIDGKLLEWLNSYLSQRKQKVCFKSCYSGLKSIFVGVPQGSVLGPLLFLVYISFVDSHKHLGVTLSSNGQWHTHIENIVNSATKILGIMRKLKDSISRNALNQMYMSYMLPVVKYASVVWDGCSEQDSQTLQKIQNEAPKL